MPAKQEERIALTSARDLHAYFAQIGASLQEPETEDSWQRLDRALARLEVVTKSGGYKYEDFVVLFKGIANPIISSLLSERTKLSGTAADVVNSVAPRLAERFESLVPIFVPTLLQICARTNKVALARAKKCLLLIAKHCRLPSLLPLLREGARDKAQTLRIVAVECTLLLLESQESKERIGKRVADVETIIRGAATDSNPEVRQWSKKVFELYVARWPERVEQLTAAFTPTIRRYLSLPKTGPYKPPASFFSVEAGKEEAVTIMEPRARPAEVASSKVAVKPARVRLAPPSSSHDEPVAARSSKAIAEVQPSSSSLRSAPHAPLSSSASSTASRPLAATAHVKTSFSVASGLNVASLTTAFTMPHARANSHTAPHDSMRSAVASVPGQRERPRVVQTKSSSSSSDPRSCEDHAMGSEHARMTMADEEKQRRRRERSSSSKSTMRTLKIDRFQCSSLTMSMCLCRQRQRSPINRPMCSGRDRQQPRLRVASR
ncbi:hypothetical protein FA10DRAFT_129226 [Acaromyces ingoldii]|uniref:CLASP N-terminal domain-containing protein n=1 Tax=Acaromyces ingoldii TaxID=215250 RepID=A0A316YQ93_9BASI|nr:hypothetical protein FA10DRAFT_129226 [Acaromyces ingoldii]PWN90984.1 hypothetical protein FA10DRAFT_129226 [Acaromyces ingoldii]